MKNSNVSSTSPVPRQSDSLLVWVRYRPPSINRLLAMSLRQRMREKKRAREAWLDAVQRSGSSRSDTDWLTRTASL